MKQEKLLYKSMIKSQFNYCPLVWMFCSRQSNNLINKIHERSLRISYKDQKTSYHNLLETHDELTIHHRNLQVLMTEIYKIVTGVAPPIMNSLSLSFEVTNTILKIFKYSQPTVEEQQIMESKQLHTERHLFGQIYHLNINLQLPLMNLK